MAGELTMLIAACLAFLGTHFVMSHPLRAPLLRALGEKGFLGLYSLVALATFAWIILAFRRTPYQTMAWDGQAEWLWLLASAITVVALVLLLGSFAGNPALPGAQLPPGGLPPPQGVFRVTRHPMMWSFALWALSHLLVAPTGRVAVLTATIALLALVGAALQDRKKQALLGAAWREWEGQTSYWPRFSRLAGAGWKLWLGALVAWLVVTWVHIPLAYVPAGIWRWAG
ncbi:MAG: NnrU family protein [Novosphingobium sp.]